MKTNKEMIEEAVIERDKYLINPNITSELCAIHLGDGIYTFVELNKIR